MFFNSFFRYFLYLTGTKFILAPIPIEEMPEMTLEEKVAYQEARIRYLEDYVEFQKKMPSILEEIYSSYSDKK